MTIKRDGSYLLKAYKKANKQRRARIIAKAGYNNEEEYFISLMSAELKTASKKTSRKKKATITAVTGDKPTIHNVYILDASSSMSGGKFNNAQKGINDEIDALKKDTTVNYTQTIVVFSYANNIRFVEYLTPIAYVLPLETRASGNTALYQATAETLTRLLSSLEGKNDKVLVKIFTDGEENDSRGEFRHPNTVASLIKKAEERGFTITFVGTKQDVKLISKLLSIDASNTLVHDNTAMGVRDAFLESYGSTVSYAKSVKAGEDVSRGFYKKFTKQS